MRWLARLLGFRFQEPPPTPRVPEVPPAVEPPKPPPFAAGFPQPPVQDMAEPFEAWKANLDHFRTHLETERLSIERFKALIDQDKMLIEGRKLAFEAEKLNRQWYLDSAKAVYDYGRYAINCVLILNGGAALAIMQHLGSARDSGGRVPLALLSTPLTILASGLAAAAGAAALSYFSQLAFTANRDRIGLAFQASAIACWLGSLGCFLAAVRLLALAMRTVAP